MSVRVSEDSRIPPPSRLPSVLTTPLSWLYHAGINHENRKYDAGRGVTRLNRPIISVGNLSTGGTGKTPVVQWACRRLLEEGHAPAIAMRGYKAPSGEMSDEQAEHREALPQVPVVAQPDRAAGLRTLLATPEGERVDCIVLDDGFQHRKIARDLDIVLIDATAPPHRDALLPRGNLREPIVSLARADAIVITRAELVVPGVIDDLGERIERESPRAIVAVCRHAWTGIDAFAAESGDRDRAHRDPRELADAPIVAVCGVGNPEGFFAMLESDGARILRRTVLRDHAKIGPQLAARLAASADEVSARAVVMTRKDWVKARRCWPRDEGPAVWTPRLGIRFDRGEDRLVSAITAAARRW